MLCLMLFALQGQSLAFSSYLPSLLEFTCMRMLRLMRLHLLTTSCFQIYLAQIHLIPYFYFIISILLRLDSFTRLCAYRFPCLSLLSYFIPKKSIESGLDDYDDETWRSWVNLFWLDGLIYIFWISFWWIIL